METSIFGLNIPAPCVRIKKELWEDYANLYKGIRNQEDPVTWRTLVMTTKKLLATVDPEFKPIRKSKLPYAKKLLLQLTKKTFLEPLLPELVYALGARNVKRRKNADLDFLLFNGRHSPEPLLWTLADFLKSKGKKVAVVNPVGHYNDGQTRVVGPSVFFRKVNKIIVLASTQTKQGGSVSVLSNVIRLIRNPKLAEKVNEIEVIIPMFGGSRGHRLNQADEVGFEVMEAAFNAKLLALPAKDLLFKLAKETKRLPQVKFFSLDIHNDLYPAKVFGDEGFKFVSIDPAPELAKAISCAIFSRRLARLPVRLVACDRGAVPRTASLAEKILGLTKLHLTNLEVVFLEKKRATAGAVSSVKIDRIEKWVKKKGKIKKIPLKIPKQANLAESVLIYSDDMIDTGGSAQKDINLLAEIFPDSALKIFVATHPVFSKGFSALKKIGADIYILGNTLNCEGLAEIKGVRLVDLAPAIYRAII